MSKVPTKLIGGIVVILVLLVGGYFLLFGTSPEEGVGSLSLTSTSTDAANNSFAVLQQLRQLRTISLNTDIFSSPTFRSLRDYGVEIQAQPIGRDNPFIPATFAPSGNVVSSDPTVFEPTNSTSTNDNAENNNPQATTTSGPETGQGF